MTDKRSPEEIRKAVREHYGTAITKGTGGCCGPQPQALDPAAARRYEELAGYRAGETEGLPDGVTSFGCGNPVNFAEIKPGQTVLDLGRARDSISSWRRKESGPPGA
ncbi:MAG TPA: hypothetical protein PLR32_00645 [candidate division Zixibacteria bacterium]|nr:hypothetical protein [candidate division Zixibacteria bacterium]